MINTRPNTYIDVIEAPSKLTIHTIPPVGDMPTSDEVVDPGLLVLVKDLGHFDPSSEIDAGAFEPESVGESHRVRGSRLIRCGMVTSRWWTG
jgi:hypothetical protein